jgi:DNA replication protein DnaC
MRTEEEWLKRNLKHYLDLLPPRINRDLQTLPTPKDLPSFIESTFLYGDTGTGKTIYTCFMLLEEQKQIYLNGGPRDETEKCAFITMPELINKIKSSYDPNSRPTEQEILNYYCNLHLLVLDDFGTSKPTDWILHILYSIINHRYDYLKKTIITSNLSLQEIALILGDDRITSRIERSYKIIRKLPYGRIH